MRTARAAICLVMLFAVLGALVLTSAPAGAVILGANGRVVFASDRSGSMQVYSMRGDGSAVTQLTTNGNNSQPAVSGDGQKIAFISDRNGTPELYSMTIDGNAQKRLTNNPMIESHPSWSPTSAGATSCQIFRKPTTPCGCVDMAWSILPRSRPRAERS